MTPLLPSTRTAQPARTAMQLALKDELRTLGFNLQRGASWLLHDVGDSLVRQVEPRNQGGTLHKLHHLIDSTAQATFSTLGAARHVAAAAVLQDTPYRTLHFRLQAMAAYFGAADTKNPSQAFTDALYWLIRHGLEGHEGAPLIVRQQAVDEAYWLVLEQHPDLALRAQLTGANPRDHAALCAAVLRALVITAPVRDAVLPPWADQPPGHAATSPALPALIAAVVTAGLAKPGDNASPDIADSLRLAGQLVTARLPLLQAALAEPGDEALIRELAFLFRHA